VSMAREEEHMETQHKHKYSSRRFQCTLCGKISKSEAALLKHIVTYHKNVTVEHSLQVSDNIFDTEGFTKADDKSLHRVESIKEIDENTGTKAKCDKCGKTLSCKSNLEWHRIRVHTKLSIFCPKCKRYFVPDHIKECHPELFENYFYKCKFCDKQFIKYSELVQHVEQGHSCGLCKIIFISAHKMEVHMREVHRITKHTNTFMLQEPETNFNLGQPRLPEKNKICGKCGSSYIKLKHHKKTCPGLHCTVAL